MGGSSAKKICEYLLLSSYRAESFVWRSHKITRRRVVRRPSSETSGMPVVKGRAACHVALSPSRSRQMIALRDFWRSQHSAWAAKYGRPYTTQTAENIQAKTKIPRPEWKYPGHIKLSILIPRQLSGLGYGPNMKFSESLKTLQLPETYLIS